MEGVARAAQQVGIGCWDAPVQRLPLLPPPLSAHVQGLSVGGQGGEGFLWESKRSGGGGDTLWGQGSNRGGGVVGRKPGSGVQGLVRRERVQAQQGKRWQVWSSNEGRGGGAGYMRTSFYLKKRSCTPLQPGPSFSVSTVCCRGLHGCTNVSGALPSAAQTVTGLHWLKDMSNPKAPVMPGPMPNLQPDPDAHRHSGGKPELVPGLCVTSKYQFPPRYSLRQLWVGRCKPHAATHRPTRRFDFATLVGGAAMA